MVKITVDIQTRILAENHSVFIVRPGAGYRLYQDVRDQATILLDLPGLELQSNTGFVEQPNLEAQILRAQAIRTWYRLGRSLNRPFPSRDINAYPLPANSAERRSLSQYTSIGRAYFERSKAGDMVIVPPLRFGDPVLVGEIVGDAPVLTSVPQYGNEAVYGRSVRWLASIPKNDVPSRVIEISQKPNSFVQLERSIATWFYDRAYKSYLLAGAYQAEFRITAEEFGSTDDARLTAFLNFVAANFEALEKKTGVVVPIQTAVFANLGEYEPDKRISINSPGEIIVHARKITPLIFMALMAMCTAVAPGEIQQAALNATITITNSAAVAGDGCTAEVFQNTVEWLKTIGVQEWLDACAIAKQAITSAGVETPATVIVKP